MRYCQEGFASETRRSSTSHKEVGQPSSRRVDTQISWEKINYKADENQLNTGCNYMGPTRHYMKTRGAGVHSLVFDSSIPSSPQSRNPAEHESILRRLRDS